VSSCNPALEAFKAGLGKVASCYQITGTCVRQAGRRLSIGRRKWTLRFFLLQVGGKRVKRDSCILQRKRVLQWLQQGSRRWKTGQAGPAQVLQESSRQVKEVAWFLGSLQVGQTSLSVGGVAVDGRSIM
jgi:hypothetical protein